MISREEALGNEPFILGECNNELCSQADVFYNKKAFQRLINNIYDSIGSCSECKHKEKCSIWVTEDFFCADFERK